MAGRIWAVTFGIKIILLANLKDGGGKLNENFESLKGVYDWRRISPGRIPWEHLHKQLPTYDIGSGFIESLRMEEARMLRANRLLRKKNERMLLGLNRLFC
ncbi:hypothetical protein CRG98_034997 [Punica granatum]|uniref:Uncharacterized protein n=1 Tax=Punica granatum TaxID=22663 RepID=A0A2I0IKW8_PUNGR|nr:hypothetical protein CRG98_034997 [Punica granatum]